MSIATAVIQHRNPQNQVVHHARAPIIPNKRTCFTRLLDRLNPIVSAISATANKIGASYFDFLQTKEEFLYKFPDDFVEASLEHKMARIIDAETFVENLTSICGDLNWKQESPLPKALMIGAVATKDLFREVVLEICHLKKTHNLQVRFVKPNKDANELWHLLYANIPPESPPELTVLLFHGSPTSMQISEHPNNNYTFLYDKYFLYSNKPNDFAARVLSRLPKNSDLILASCLTGLGGNNCGNMAGFFSAHAPQVRVHAPQVAIDWCKFSPTKTVEWQAPYASHLLKSLLLFHRFKKRTGDPMPCSDIFAAILNSLIYRIHGEKCTPFKS